MRKLLTLFFAALFLVAFQVSAGPLLAIWGVVPNFPLAAVFLWARDGWNRDFLIFTFFCAVILEIFSGEAAGVIIASFFITGLVLGFLFEAVLGRVKGLRLALFAFFAVWFFDFTRYAAVIILSFFGTSDALAVGAAGFIPAAAIGSFYNLVIILAVFYILLERRDSWLKKSR